jgi:hypothetical protein
MSVDMSAKAVTQRLKILEQLWELSVSLMRTKSQQSEALVNEESLAETRYSLESDGARHDVTTSLEQ